MSKIINININNIGVGQLGRVGGVTKDGLSETNKSGLGGANKEELDGTLKGEMNRANKDKMSETNKGGMGEANKSKVGKANKSKVSKANIKVSMKVSARAVTSTDNNIDNSGKVTDWHAGFADLAFATLTTINYTRNSNSAIFEETSWITAPFIFDEFFATFAILANITLEKESNICKFNFFLFAVNRQ